MNFIEPFAEQIHFSNYILAINIDDKFEEFSLKKIRFHEQVI